MDSSRTNRLKQRGRSAISQKESKEKDSYLCYNLYTVTCPNIGSKFESCKIMILVISDMNPEVNPNNGGFHDFQAKNASGEVISFQDVIGKSKKYEQLTNILKIFCTNYIYLKLYILI